jgi:multidrug efflux system membrane fusion protein
MTDMQAAGPIRTGSSRTRWIVIIVVVLLILLVVVHLIRSHKTKPGTPPQVVRVARAFQGDMPEVLSELGTVTPVATVTVLPQLSGYLTEVGYKEGQDVEKGQFLAQIDPRQYEIDLQQAQAALLKDQAALDQARSDLERYESLDKQKAIAQQTLMDQRFLVKQDEAQVKSDASSIAQYKLDLVYCHIVAPVAGRVGLRLIDPGNYVTASSSPGIVVITTMKPTLVQFTVAQNDLASVVQRVGAGAQLPVTALSSDNTRQIATGTLYALINKMATATGTVSMRATFANDDEALFPNEFVNVRMLVDTLKNAVLVPTPAVLNGAPGDYVYLVNTTDKTVAVRKVTLGPSDGKNTAITAGLALGDTVVIDGTDRLTDGAKISIAAAAAAAATPGAAPGAAAGAHARQKGAAPPRGTNAQGTNGSG